MTMFLKVKGCDGLVRDVTTNAILNNDKTEYERYLAQKNANLSKKAEIERHAEEINNIKSDLTEIKQMLLTLMSSSNSSLK